MALAITKRCDICGVLYEPYNESDNGKKVNGFMYLNIDLANGYYPHKAVDCCPECMTNIMNYIESLKGEKKR